VDTTNDRVVSLRKDDVILLVRGTISIVETVEAQDKKALSTTRGIMDKLATTSSLSISIYV
jgi:hypothetical protein